MSFAEKTQSKGRGGKTEGDNPVTFFVSPFTIMSKINDLSPKLFPNIAGE